jgi:hypothetical protein
MFFYNSVSVNSFRMRNVSDKFCTGNQNTHFVFNNFFLKSCPLYCNVKKSGTARQTTDDNIIRHRTDRFPYRITEARIQTSTLIHNIFNNSKNILYFETVQKERIVVFRWQYWTLLYCWQLRLRQQQQKENYCWVPTTTMVSERATIKHCTYVVYLLKDSKVITLPEDVEQRISLFWNFLYYLCTLTPIRFCWSNFFSPLLSGCCCFT